MSEHANVAAVRNVVQGFLTGDLDRILGAYTGDAIYRVGGDNIVSGNFKGHVEIRDFLIHLATVTDEWKVDVEDILADDHHAALVMNFTTRRGERTLEATAAMAFKVAPDGRFTESWFLCSDQAAYDDFYREYAEGAGEAWRIFNNMCRKSSTPRRAAGAYLAYSTARCSRITITLI